MNEATTIAWIQCCAAAAELGTRAAQFDLAWAKMERAIKRYARAKSSTENR